MAQSRIKKGCTDFFQQFAITPDVAPLSKNGGFGVLVLSDLHVFEQDLLLSREVLVATATIEANEYVQAACSQKRFSDGTLAWIFKAPSFFGCES